MLQLSTVEKPMPMTTGQWLLYLNSVAADAAGVDHEEVYSGGDGQQCQSRQA